MVEKVTETKTYYKILDSRDANKFVLLSEADYKTLVGRPATRKKRNLATDKAVKTQTRIVQALPASIMDAITRKELGNKIHMSTATLFLHLRILLRQNRVKRTEDMPFRYFTPPPENLLATSGETPK